MAKKQSALKRAREGEREKQKQAPATPLFSLPRDARRWYLIGLFLVIALGGCWLVFALQPGIFGVPQYTYKVIKKFPHDGALFTQGILIAADQSVYESHGKYEQSGLRKYELETGKILKKIDLDRKYFAEGLARFSDQLFQLTWKEGVAFVYDMDLNPVKQFTFDGEGWGLAATETELVMSDGTHRLSFRDPQTFEEIRHVWVRIGGRPVNQLNELEYYAGKIYANQLDRDFIYEIEPENGNVTAMIDLNGLWPHRERPPGGVLNGIAVVPGTKRMLVTGKYCPNLFEIELTPK